MLNIMNFGTAPSTGKTQSVGTSDTTQNAATGAGEAAGGFAALLAQVMTSEAPTTEGANGGLGKLAAMLKDFRAEAQESLAEVFPDGVIAPGPALNDWAKSMLTKLDGMLQQAGASFADLGQLLAPLDGAMLKDAGGLLMQAAQSILSGSDTGVPTETGGDVVADLLAADPGAEDMPRLMAALEDIAEDASEALSKLVATPQITQAVSEGVEVGDLAQAAPLPDALRIVLAQVMAAPADRSLPPEVQAILSAPQPTAAPLIASVAETAPPQQAATPNPNHGLARNLAGQIRGVSFTEGTTRIELTPQGLGTIEIEIAADEAGKLRVVLRAENPAVLNAMRSDREMLAGLLRDGGSSVDESAMSFEDFGNQRQAAQQQPQGSGPDSRLTVGDASDPAETAQDSEVAITDDGRLNVLT